MIRIICVESEITMGGYGPMQTLHKSFDVSLPEIEEWLNRAKNTPGYSERAFVGIELLDKAVGGDDA